MLARNDDMGQSLLSLAARSGSKDALEGVLLVIRREFTEFEVKGLLASGNSAQEEKQTTIFQRALTPLPRRTRDMLVSG